MSFLVAHECHWFTLKCDCFKLSAYCIIYFIEVLKKGIRKVKFWGKLGCLWYDKLEHQKTACPKSNIYVENLCLKNILIRYFYSLTLKSGVSTITQTKSVILLCVDTIKQISSIQHLLVTLSFSYGELFYNGNDILIW